MAITKESIANVSLDDFISTVRGIYDTQDAKRSSWDIWLHANNHAAAIGEEARKYEPGEKLLQEIADFSMWLFTLVGKIIATYGAPINSHGIEETTIRIDNEFSDLVWNKYPRMCPVCFWRRTKEGMKISSKDFNRPCDCLLYPVESRDQSEDEKRDHIKKLHIKKLHKYAKEHYSDKPPSVDLWQGMFYDIYRSNLRHLRLQDIAFHLLEEVGEVSNAMSRMYTYGKDKFKPGEPSWHRIYLENEIADVASWLFTLVNSLELIPRIASTFQKYVFGSTVMRDDQITLSGIIWGRYGANVLNKLYCPHCKSSPICECPIILVSTDELLTQAKNYVTDVLY